MQVFCKSTDGNAEFRCSVCGQGFVVFWERQALMERIALVSEIQDMLLTQHRNRLVHPEGGFWAPGHNTQRVTEPEEALAAR